MIPSTETFKRLVESGGKKKKKSIEESSGYPHKGEMPAIDTLSPVTKPKKAKK